MQKDTFTRTSPPAPDDEDRKDELYRALSDHRRRVVVRELQASSSALSIDELANRIARREAQRPTDPSPDEMETVRLSLYHTHLPKLAEASVVEYDVSNRTVEFRWPTGDR